VVRNKSLGSGGNAFHTFPAIGSAMLGIFTGNWLRSEKDQTTKTVWLFVWGSVLMVAGYGLGWLVPNQQKYLD
jgi:predicted acyltransferase